MNRILEKNGYKTGLIHFPGIEMLLELPKNRYFRNDGIVPDLQSHANKFTGGKYVASSSEKEINAKGLCITYDILDYKFSTIFIVDSGRYQNMCIYGHESVHAIEKLNLEDQFSAKLGREGLVIKPFAEYKDVETIANLGLILADYNFKKWLMPNKMALKSLYNILLQKTDGWTENEIFSIVEHSRIIN
jgi:hypothetical protein